MKQKASELFAKLAPALGDDEARLIVKGKIDKGDLEDDLGAAPVISQTQLSSVLDELKKAFTPEQVPAQNAVATLKPNRLNKGGSFVGNEGGFDAQAFEDAMSSLESRIEGALQTQEHQYTQMAKGLKGISDIHKATYVALAEIDRRATEQAAQIEKLVKGLEAISKAGPKAVNPGTAIVPQPGESKTTIQAAQQAVAAATGSESVDKEIALFAKAEAHINRELQKGDVPEDRRVELQHALGLLLSGEAPSQVNQAYKLGLS